MLEINATVRIPKAELEFQTSRSSSPGGQHVNRTESRVTLRWDLESTESLKAHEKRRLYQRLATRITRDGILHLTAQKHRSQHRNRALLEERFVELLREALKQPKKRRPTKRTRSSKERRLKQKRVRSDVKRNRKRPEQE